MEEVGIEYVQAVETISAACFFVNETSDLIWEDRRPLEMKSLRDVRRIMILPPIWFVLFSRREIMNAEMPAPSKSGFPMWLLVVGAVIACLAVVGIAACVLVFGGLTLAGPQIGNSFTSIILALECQSQGDGTTEECEAWANEVSSQNSSLVQNCADQYADDAPALYQCVVDEVGRP